jgi:acetyltransferase-like isoleucine patch superfamily enzyme
MTDCSSLVSLGNDADIDEGVLLGYRTGREIPSQQLTIGAGACLRSGTIVYAGSTIGRNFQSGHNVIIREENTIGDDVSIWSSAVVDYGCRIGDRVKIHCDVYVAQYTTIEDDVFLAPGVVVANDIHPGCPHSVECMRGPTIRRGAQIGANVTLLPRVTIGEHALIGAGSVVTRDIPARAVAYGNPARVCKSVSDLVCVTGITDVPYPDL